MTQYVEEERVDTLQRLIDAPLAALDCAATLDLLVGQLEELAQVVQAPTE